MMVSLLGTTVLAFPVLAALSTAAGEELRFSLATVVLVEPIAALIAVMLMWRHRARIR